jgi:hypothetical protein
MRILILGTVLVHAGCTEPPGIALHCPGEPPLLADCFSGNYFAECGGTGGPLFACAVGEYDGCRWFTDGCVSEGHVVSTCPADDLCCHDDFPFTHDQLGDEDAYWVGEQLRASGTRPWNRHDHMDVAVAVDPGLVAQPTDLVCVGDMEIEAESGPCGLDTVTAGLGDMMFIQTYSGGWGSTMQIEIDLTAPGGVRARACLAQRSDIAAGRRCPFRDDVECAVAGLIVVNQLDDAEALAGTLDLRMASGARLSGTFRDHDW